MSHGLEDGRNKIMKVNWTQINEAKEYNKNMEDLPPLEYTSESIGELRDHVEDTSFSTNKKFFSDDSILAVRNLLDLCGKKFTMEQVNDYVRKEDLLEYVEGDDFVGRFEKGSFIADKPYQLEKMIKGLGGIEVQTVDIKDQKNMMQVVDQVNQGYRAIMRVGGGFIHENEKPQKSFGGTIIEPIAKLLELKPDSERYVVDTVVTLLRSERPGYMYICDPYYADGNGAGKCVEISTDKLLESSVKTGGEVIITKEAYPIHSSELGFYKNRIFCNGYEVLPSHLEGMKTEELRSLSPEKSMEKVGEQVYAQFVKPFAGCLKQFVALSGFGDCNTFAEKYSEYVLNAKEMKSENLPLYNFLKEVIFEGREFLAPRQDISFTGEKSYGNAMNRSAGMTWEQGDNRYEAKGTCGETAISNQLAICGENFSEKYITDFARIRGYGDFNPDLPPEKRGGIYLNCVEQMVEELTDGRVKLERVERGDGRLTPEWIAEKLDRGHAGLFVVNIGLLHGKNPTNFNKSILGEKEPMMDHVVTPLVAVREETNGEVKGFYVCDSGSNDRAYYVESGQLMKAMNVCDGMVFFTEKSYLAR